MKRFASLFLVAVQYLTRVPVSAKRDVARAALAEAGIFFPVVGFLIGLGAVGLNLALWPHVGHDGAIVLILVYLVVLTGGLHEDALADAADGFGGGWSKQQMLDIMRDSRIGSFGAVAVTLSLLARYVFLASLPRQSFNSFLLAGQVLSRWSVLPLGFFLSAARGGTGEGARVAGEIRWISLAGGTLIAIVIAFLALGPERFLWSLLVSVVVIAATGTYYHSRLGGVTGDCLGATCQITEAAVYLTGVVLK